MTTEKFLKSWPQITRMMDEYIAKFDLDLQGLTVLTEAASGPYCVTPFLAARSKAKAVYAFVKDNKYSSKNEVIELFNHLGSGNLGIQLIDELDPTIVRSADLVTNSGNLRPIDNRIIPYLRPGSVVSLMYEKWEQRQEDIDMGLCRSVGISVVAPFEFNQNVNFGADLIKMTQFGLEKISPGAKKIGLICDNKFKESILSIEGVSELTLGSFNNEYDCVVLARTPKARNDYSDIDFSKILSRKFLQLWGNIDRSRLPEVNFYPHVEPKLNHMGVIPSDVDGASVVKLQTVGLKVAECVLRKIPLDAYGEYILK